MSLEDIRWFLEAEAVVKPGTLGWGCGSEAKQITALFSREALGWCTSATHEETHRGASCDAGTQWAEARDAVQYLTMHLTLHPKK